jgi:hypothetical protein
VNTVACGDQVKAVAPIEIARAPSDELEAVLQALLRGGFAGLSDGLRIGRGPPPWLLPLRHGRRRNRHRERGLHSAIAGDIRKLCEPVAAKALLVLTGVDHIERNDAFRPELLEPHAIACAECIGDLRRDAEQCWGKVEQSAARTASAPASDFFEGVHSRVFQRTKTAA